MGLEGLSAETNRRPASLTESRLTDPARARASAAASSSMYFKSMARNRVRLDLVDRTQGNIDKSGKLTGTAPSTSLGNIRADRYCCPASLRDQPELLVPWEARCQVVDATDKLPAGLPGLQFSEVAHPNVIQVVSEAAKYFVRIRTDMRNESSPLTSVCGRACHGGRRRPSICHRTRTPVPGRRPPSAVRRLLVGSPP